MDIEYMIISFSSTHQAMHFEKCLLMHFAIELIPTPRHISASCGLSIKFEVEDHISLIKHLEDEDKMGIKLYHFIIGNSDCKVIPLEWEV